MAAQAHIISTTTTMARMGRLETGNMRAEFRLFEPVGNSTAQAAHALGRVPGIFAVQRMAGKGRFTFARDDEDRA